MFQLRGCWGGGYSGHLFFFFVVVVGSRAVSVSRGGPLAQAQATSGDQDETGSQPRSGSHIRSKVGEATATWEVGVYVFARSWSAVPVRTEVKQAVLG